MRVHYGFLAVALLSSTSFADEQHLLGKISDACAPAEGKPADPACKGPKYVFTARGKTYRIANPDYPGLAGRSGQMARVTGDVQSESITIKSIAESSGKKK
jgi:hypothetical protein